jgi:hypothetical protein
MNYKFITVANTVSVGITVAVITVDALAILVDL